MLIAISLASVWTSKKGNTTRLKSRSLTLRELYIKIELVRSLGASGTGVFDYRIFFYAYTCSLKSNHRSLVRRDGLSKDNIFPPELGVIGKLPVKVKSGPAFTVAFYGPSLQYNHNGGGRPGFRSQLIHKRVLHEKSFFNIIFRCSHDDLPPHLLKHC
jgi:hypothetical protein